MSWMQLENRYNQDKVYDACGLFGYIDTTGRRYGGDRIITAIDSMKERGNGLGSGFAAYGLYPEFAEHYAFHVMCRDDDARKTLDDYLRRHFAVVHDEPIPTRNVLGILDPPSCGAISCCRSAPRWWAALRPITSSTR
jgi:glutamate synthase domain-containing protein 1